MRSLVTTVLVLLFSKLVTGLPDCPMMFRSVGTVCGTDGVTYPTLCELEVARIFDPVLDIGYFGKCTTYCKDIWDPVCGNDMVTYSSLCLLEIEARKHSSLEVLHVGKCWSGEDKSTQVTDCIAMKNGQTDVKCVQPTHTTNRIEVAVKVEADKPRIYKKVKYTKRKATTKKPQQRHKSYVDTVQKQWEAQGFFSR